VKEAVVSVLIAEFFHNKEKTKEIKRKIILKKQRKKKTIRKEIRKIRRKRKYVIFRA